MDETIHKELTRYKRHRESVLHADGTGFEHHLHEFIREIHRNTLTKPVLNQLPAFDVNGWLEGIINRRTRTIDRFELPADDNERLAILLDLAESMAAPASPDKMSVNGFGQLLRIHKHDRSVAAAIEHVIRPLCDLMTERLHEAAAIANPAVRELAGVPLDRIPAPNETDVFLSHKSADKPLVRPFYEVLKALGFSPFFDEKSMKPGDTLHREITAGFDRACAVVFFITQNFVDAKWLAKEIDSAINRKVARGERFGIITLSFNGVEVPRALQEYIWVNVQNEVHALHEILRGLPIELGPPRWRA